MGVMGVVVRNKKLDWAQRAVEPYEWHEGIDGGVFATHIRADNAAALLRAHHRKVKRVINKILDGTYHEINGFDMALGFDLALKKVLAKLKEMER